MPRIVLASALCRWLPPSADRSRDVALDVPARSLDEALGALFERYPMLRDYVLDEHGTVRHHVAVFIDGVAIADKRNPVQALQAASEVYVMQALSGG